MSGYLLDTDTCIFFLQGKYAIKEKIKSVGFENCFVSEITIGELLFGAEYSNDVPRHIAQVDQFIKHFQIIPLFDALRLYAKEKTYLRRNGIMIAEFDLLIGVTAVAKDLIMVTNNEKHLQRIRNIQIENWTQSTFNEFI